MKEQKDKQSLKERVLWSCGYDVVLCLLRLIVKWLGK